MRTVPIRLVLAPIAGACLLVVAPPLAAQRPSAPSVADSARIDPADWKGAGPNGATLRCRDRSYPAPKAPDSACDAKGGVLVRYPLIPVPGPRGRPAPATVRAPVPAATPATPATAAPAATSAPGTSGTASGTPPAARPPLPPPDATLLCNDGTFIQADTASSRCGTHGGVRGRFPFRPRATVRRP